MTKHDLRFFANIKVFCRQ